MKKGIRVLALFGLAVIFTASAAFAAPQQLTMGTGGTAGTYYPFGGAMSQIISDNSNGTVNITAQSTGASIENINLLAAGDVDLIIVQNDLSDYAVTALNSSRTGRSATSPPSPVSIPRPSTWSPPRPAASRPSPTSRAKTFPSAPRKRERSQRRQIFDVYGLKYDDIKPHFISYAETTDHFKDRLVDAFLYTTERPIRPSRTSAPSRTSFSFPSTVK